jgi:hypothetical protein
LEAQELENVSAKILRHEHKRQGLRRPGIGFFALLLLWPIEPPVKNRRSLTPTPEGSRDERPGGLHATRRGGARREVSARVTLSSPSRAGAAAGGASGTVERTLEGWALNVSRGGVRVILEEKVDLGAEFDVAMVGGPGLAEPPVVRVGRVVWVQEELDGVVAGVEFRDDDVRPGEE